MRFSKNDVIKLLRSKIILNIFSFRGHRTLKPKSKLILKIYFLFNSKLNGRKLRFNTPLIMLHKKNERPSKEVTLAPSRGKLIISSLTI